MNALSFPWLVLERTPHADTLMGAYTDCGVADKAARELLKCRPDAEYAVAYVQYGLRAEMQVIREVTPGCSEG